MNLGKAPKLLGILDGLDNTRSRMEPEGFSEIDMDALEPNRDCKCRFRVRIGSDPPVWLLLPKVQSAGISDTPCRSTCRASGILP